MRRQEKLSSGASKFIERSRILSDLFSWRKVLINGDTYLQLLQNKFWPAFNRFDEVFIFLIMKDLFIPHWFRVVGETLDENIPNQG